MACYSGSGALQNKKCVSNLGCRAWTKKNELPRGLRDQEDVWSHCGLRLRWTLLRCTKKHFIALNQKQNLKKPAQRPRMTLAITEGEDGSFVFIQLEWGQISLAQIYSMCV